VGVEFKGCGIAVLPFGDAEQCLEVRNYSQYRGIAEIRDGGGEVGEGGT